MAAEGCRVLEAETSAEVLVPSLVFFQKPFTGEAFLKKVREVLDASPSGEARS